MATPAEQLPAIPPERTAVTLWSAPTINISSNSGIDEIDILAVPGVTTLNTDTNNGVPDHTVIGSTLATFNAGVGTLANILGTVNINDSGGVGDLHIDDSGDAT